jgi:uncharacterized membrane protein YjgN (DUF898 family)
MGNYTRIHMRVIIKSNMSESKNFTFDGGAGTYLGTSLLALLVTVGTLGIAYPFGLVLMQRWKAKHTLIQGSRLKFTGTGVGLFGQWIKWFLLILITAGIYSFWVRPRLNKWIVEHTDFSDIQAL